ncbi:MAG: hypothetical protein CM1200mP16_15780 [Nitrospina sp.]|nr:MAG: hypothetical protein CM1200mP16_15780 [Nitrospina sp.]
MEAAKADRVILQLLVHGLFASPLPAFPLNHGFAEFDEISDHGFDITPDKTDFGYLKASTFIKGDLASLASRLAFQFFQPLWGRS